MKKRITPQNGMLCFVKINSIPFNLLRVWIMFQNTSSHSCFRNSGHVCVQMRNLETVHGGRTEGRYVISKELRNRPERKSHYHKHSSTIIKPYSSICFKKMSVHLCVHVQLV